MLIYREVGVAGGGGGEGDDLSTGVSNDFLSGVVDDGAGRGGPIWAVTSRLSDCILRFL